MIIARALKPLMSKLSSVLAPVLLLSACGAEPLDDEAEALGTAEHYTTLSVNLPFHGTRVPHSRWTGMDNFYGYSLNTGAYVDAITTVHWDWLNPGPVANGPWGGSGGSNCGYFECYGGNEWLVGYYGRAGDTLDQLGFICGDPYDPTSQYDLPACGGGGGAPFREVCPPGYNIGQFGVFGSSVGLVTGLSIYCWDTINPYQ